MRSTPRGIYGKNGIYGGRRGEDTSPYLSQHWRGEDTSPYLSQHWRGEDTSPYLSQHRRGEDTSPYLSQHRRGEDTSPYLSQHRRGEDTAPYLSQHWRGEDTSPYLSQHWRGEDTSPYLSQHRRGEDTAPYLSQHRRGEDTAPYLVRRGVLTAALLVWMWVLPVRSAEVVVFGAASLSDVLKEAAAIYEKKGGDKIIFNFAASSVLERQIEEGAPADIFFSADEKKMKVLEEKGLILKETRKSRLSNSLVIVVAAKGGVAIDKPEDLAGEKVKRLALAEPKSVPAGIYAREYLEKRDLWRSVESKVVPTENVRGALAAVEAGNAEAGIVYKTDAKISRQVKVAYEIPTADAPEISYPMAVLRGSKAPEAARRFHEYLASEEAERFSRNMVLRRGIKTG